MNRNFNHTIPLCNLSPPAWQGYGYHDNQGVAPSFNTPGAESSHTNTNSQQSGELLPSPHSWISDTTGTAYDEEEAWKMVIEEEYGHNHAYESTAAYAEPIDYFSHVHVSNDCTPASLVQHGWDTYGGSFDIKNSTDDPGWNLTVPQEVQPAGDSMLYEYTVPGTDIAATLQTDDGGIRHNNEAFDNTREIGRLAHNNNNNNSNAQASHRAEGCRIKRECNSNAERHYCAEAGCMANPSGFTRRKDMLRHVQETHREQRPYVCSRDNFKAGLFCKNMPDEGCGKGFKREAHLMNHWNKKKTDKKFLKIMGLNSRSRQKKKQRKKEVMERKESFGLIRKLTGLSV